jgi:hypothetical protein
VVGLAIALAIIVNVILDLEDPRLSPDRHAML